ncbi:uncharacterized protein J3D65DRAFT_281026 [Phyllosticta citribraziliensis]|uniref:BTB domain-containing protein n=1 Tax=Phyllosticta citribraziliensis TaxID=989973 RepID=A0ABR1LXX2_9PEZI
MADSKLRAEETPAEGTPAGDVEMDGAEETPAEGTPAEVSNEPTTGAGEGEGEGEDASMLPDVKPEAPEIIRFLDYLKSPIVEIMVGQGEAQTQLTAHQALLTKSPFFNERVAEFNEATPRRIDLPNEDLEATGSLLEFLYHGDYFPKRTSDSKDSPLEDDPTVPEPDNEGVALLKHARVYALADRFGLPELKSLAHGKIHRTSSTAKGEIAYARFVYAETSPTDATIRKPVAAFWATRSHVLRHAAEAEFRAMCLEYPQFGFDVLSLVLDAREKRSARTTTADDAAPSSSAPQVLAGISTDAPRSGRKRTRVSLVS